MVTKASKAQAVVCAGTNTYGFSGHWEDGEGVLIEWEVRLGRE